MADNTELVESLVEAIIEDHPDADQDEVRASVERHLARDYHSTPPGKRREKGLLSGEELDKANAKAAKAKAREAAIKLPFSRKKF